MRLTRQETEIVLEQILNGQAHPNTPLTIITGKNIYPGRGFLKHLSRVIKEGQVVKKIIIYVVGERGEGPLACVWLGRGEKEIGTPEDFGFPSHVQLEEILEVRIGSV